MKRLLWGLLVAIALLGAVFAWLSSGSGNCVDCPKAKAGHDERPFPPDRLAKLKAQFPVQTFADPRGLVARKWDVAVGGAGPSVLVIHELPGMTPETLALAEELTKNGYRVYLPKLYGEVGEHLSGPEMVHFAFDRRINPIADELSPMAHELRGLVRAIRVHNAGQPVGAVGMCLTGNFVLALMPEEGVRAAVLSQPSLPFAFRPYRNSLGASRTELDAAKKSGVPMLGLRYECDEVSPCQRAIRFRDEFQGQLEWHELPGVGHAALTMHAHPDAKRWFFEFLDRNLKPRTDPAAAR